MRPRDRSTGNELWIVRRTLFEHRTEPLLGKVGYLRRQMKFLVGAFVFIGCALAIGTLGYMHFAGERSVDAFLDASMILSGMGPVGVLPNDAAKVFASCYALFSGIALLTTVAVILAPLVHRFLHIMHLDEKD